MSRRRRLADVSLATRLSLVALAVTLVSLSITATVGLIRGNQLADGLAEDRLVTISASRTDGIERYFRNVESEIAALAVSPGAAAAITGLGDAYRELQSSDVGGETSEELTQFYLSDVVPELEAVRSAPVGASLLVPDQPAAVYLQHVYTIPQEDEEGQPIDPQLVADPGDGSSYSEAHPAVHETYGQISIVSGFDDLFLIDARNDVIVYSARKRIDFATSLDLGPSSGTSLARLVDALGDDPEPGDAGIVDFSAFAAAGDRPTAFAASPVLVDGTLVGFVAAAIGIDQVDTIMSGNGEWSGFGDTGEAYLVGPDATMRSTARTYEESPSTFLAEANTAGPGALSEADRRRIVGTGTTALVQSVDRRVTVTAQQGAGVIDAVNYQGVDVLTAYRPVDVEGLQWVVFTDVAAAEFDDPIEDYARNMLFAMALFIVVVTFVAVRWSDRLMVPIKSIAARLRRVRADSEAEASAVPETAMRGGPDEYEELSVNVDQMLERLQERQLAVEARSAERLALLRQFLPAAVAQRSEQGQGDVLDHIRNASVVVVTVDGLGALVGDESEQSVRDLLGEIIDEADALSADLGLERVKLTGGTYHAVCGVNRPFLDHAPRSVMFGLAARDLVDEVSGGRLSVRVGVDSGPISVGLTARSGLIYDAWGDTVSGAEELARHAPPGAIAVSDTVREQLSSHFVVVAGGDGGAIVTGRVEQEAAT